MNDIERRLCWHEVRKGLYLNDFDDWPEALPFLCIAWLARCSETRSQQARCAYEAMKSFLEGEITAGRLLQRGELITMRRENGSRNEVIKLETVRIDDAAKLFSGVMLGKYLEAWLAPCRQETAGPSDINNSSRTEMKRSAIIERLERTYPRLADDFNRSEDWIKKCRTGRHGWYFLEQIEDGCRNKWGDRRDSSLLAEAAKIHIMK